MRSNLLASPAISLVGRHNSGKTTLAVALIERLTAQGLDIGSVKHHSHAGFEIDIPGKDSYRHRHAGATRTIIAAPGQVALVETVEGDSECQDLVERMPGHDLVIVEGYRKSGLPTIEVMRSGNEADQAVAEAFARVAEQGGSLDEDFVQLARSLDANADATRRADVAERHPDARTVAVVTDIPCAREAAARFGIPSFDLGDIAGIARFLTERFARQRVSVVIQAGGESRRMGQSKSLVPFGGRPLIMRLIERLAPAADELIITTNEADRLAFVHESYPELGIRLVPDILSERGALPGMYTAFEAASCELVALVACDMVFASPRLIAAEAREMFETGSDVVVPVNKHGFEPFHAMYRRSACLPAARAALDAGEKRAQALFSRVNVGEFPQARVLKAEPMGGCFVNVNTPQELRAIESGLLGV